MFLNILPDDSGSISTGFIKYSKTIFEDFEQILEGCLEDQIRGDQTRPDQRRSNQTRPDQARQAMTVVR